jgi:hypothetical protein
MAKIVKGTAKTVARSPSERRIGWGFTFLGGGVGGMIALGSLIWPTVLYPIPLFAVCGLVCVSGVAMVVHGGGSRTPQPNLPIARAIDYLVNDSTALLEQNPPPEVSTFGPAKGRVLAWNGKPQQDAGRKIEEQLGFGTLVAFGRSALTPGNDPINFDAILRTIPHDYWSVGGLHPLFARIDESAHAQTHLRSMAGGRPLYGDVKVDADQLKALWKPKSLWRRVWERRIQKKERIRDHLFDPMPQPPSH